MMFRAALRWRTDKKPDAADTLAHLQELLPEKEGSRTKLHEPDLFTSLEKDPTRP